MKEQLSVLVTFVGCVKRPGGVLRMSYAKEAGWSHFLHWEWKWQPRDAGRRPLDDGGIIVIVIMKWKAYGVKEELLGGYAYGEFVYWRKFAWEELMTMRIMEGRWGRKIEGHEIRGHWEGTKLDSIFLALAMRKGWKCGIIGKILEERHLIVINVREGRSVMRGVREDLIRSRASNWGRRATRE
ncbi:unnamed protein product [Linum trigynum]|uniref:Uncharacterized protein n=1 Tax=Linum trigynum TaxID=586398 RepID=A0AAV2FPU7_9ROSI